VCLPSKHEVLRNPHTRSKEVLSYCPEIVPESSGNKKGFPGLNSFYKLVKIESERVLLITLN
jgi:hypothetical protein